MSVDSNGRNLSIAAWKSAIQLAVVLAFIGFQSMAQAGETRTWTDVDGRTMQAQMLGMDEGKVRLLLQGSETAFPLERLSADDIEFVEQWEEQRKARGTMFDGRRLETGGKINLFEFEYDEAARELAKKRPDKADTGYRIAIAVPEGFDSTQPQKVFIALNAGNNAAQNLEGNTGVLHRYAADAVAEGWVAIAYDSDRGNIGDTLPWICALAKISTEWPDFKNWMIANGGSSGGAKRTMLNTPFLMARDIPVRGMFISSCNGAENMVRGRDQHKISKADMSDIRCFVSTGKNDRMVSSAHHASVVATLRGEGLRTIREEWFDGGHGINSEHFRESLRWFAQDQP